MFDMRQLIFLVVLLDFICLFEWTHGRSVSMIGDVNIDISDDRFICDKIECPTNTDRCVVSKEKDTNNARVLVRSNTCYSASNKVLKDSVTTEAIDANSHVKFNIVAHRNGMISSVVNSNGPYMSTNFDAEQFNKDMSNFQQNIQKDLENLNRDLTNMGLELDNMFG